MEIKATFQVAQGAHFNDLLVSTSHRGLSLCLHSMVYILGGVYWYDPVELTISTSPHVESHPVRFKIAQKGEILAPCMVEDLLYRRQYYTNLDGKVIEDWAWVPTCVQKFLVSNGFTFPPDGEAIIYHLSCRNIPSEQMSESPSTPKTKVKRAVKSKTRSTTSLTSK